MLRALTIELSGTGRALRPRSVASQWSCSAQLLDASKPAAFVSDTNVAGERQHGTPRGPVASM